MKHCDSSETFENKTERVGVGELLYFSREIQEGFSTGILVGYMMS